jgi:cation transport ATPase
MAAAEGVAAVTGTGMTARVNGQKVLVGNGALLSDQPIAAGTVVERAASWLRGQDAHVCADSRLEAQG